MPIYEFVCQSCGNEFEQIRSFSDTSVPTCSVCGSVQVVRRMGRPAIHFKGSGWYITDSKKSSKESAVGATGNGASSNGASSNGSEKKPESTTESAGAAKSENKPEPAREAKSEPAKTPAE